MKSTPLIAIAMGALLLTGSTIAQESPEQRGIRRSRDRTAPPPVLKEGAGVRTTPAPQPSATPAPAPGGELRVGGEQEGGLFQIGGAGAAPGPDDPNSPRPLRSNPLSGPFYDDRTVIEVDGVAVSSLELNQLVAYYQTFRPGSADLLLRDAVAALVARAAVQARYASALDGMKERIGKAKAELEEGKEFAEVVQAWSDDKEAPNPEGRYEFGREVAVQPFDRLAHTGGLNQLQGPFLTQYGYHLLEIVGYERGSEPKEDRTTVRHVLVMFPFESDDPRSEIKALVEGCKIKILDPGLANLLPPELRDNQVN